MSARRACNLVYDHLARNMEPQAREQLDADLHADLDPVGELDEPDDGWAWGDPVTVDMTELDEDQQAWLREWGVLS